MTAHHWIRTQPRTPYGVVRVTTRTIAGALLVIGVLGFVPGITADHDTLAWAGPDSGAMLFGVFQVSALHNLVHLALGLVGLALSMRSTTAAWYLVAGGLGFGALWVHGLLVEDDAAANVLPVNRADDWLHLGLAAGMLLVGAAALVALREAAGRPDQG